MSKLLPSDYFSLNNLSYLVKRVEEWNYIAYRPDFEHQLTVDTLWDRQTRLVHQSIKNVIEEIESFSQSKLELRIAELIIELCYKVSIHSNVFHKGKTSKFVYSEARVGQHDQLTNSHVLRDTNFDKQKLELKSLLLDLVYINEVELEKDRFDINNLLSFILEILIRTEIYKYPNMVKYTEAVMDSKFSIFNGIEIRDGIIAEMNRIKETIGRDDVYVYTHGSLVIFKDKLGDVLKPSYYQEPLVEDI